MPWDLLYVAFIGCLSHIHDLVVCLHYILLGPL